MGNFFGKAALITAAAAVIALSADCRAENFGGGVWGNTGNYLEIDDIPAETEDIPAETEAKPAETEPAIPQDKPVPKPGDTPKSPWKRTGQDSYGKSDPSDKDKRETVQSIRQKPAAEKKTDKTAKIVDSADSKYSYDDMREDIEKLIAAYPKLIRAESIGTTADKRKIYDIIIGNVSAEKQIVIQAGCHGREYMTCLLAMDMTEYCLRGYNSISYGGKRLSEYFEEFQIHIVPMLNPDGVTISQTGAKGLKNPQLRKNAAVMYKNAVAYRYTSYPEERYYERWKANAHGVDINRNFDGKWGMAKEYKCAGGWGYKGTYPESETESRAIVKLIDSLSNPVTVISYHATGSVVWWDYNQQGAFRSRCYAEAKLISDMTGYKLNPYDKTSCAGLCDRIIEKGGGRTVPILIEIGKGECPLSISEYEEIFGKNYRLIPVLMDHYSQ